VVERLKEKRWAAHQVARLRHEQKELDEIALSRHVRSES
jgi:flagellar biosynthesis chaperone FliJ